jgi:hypothetical protein
LYSHANATTEYKVVRSSIQFEAGAAQYTAWPGGTTIHSGIGYIEPYGQASYACGVNYPETKTWPMPAYLAELVKAQSSDSNPLFCIYTTKAGLLYVYDVVVGNVFLDAQSNEKQDQLINVIVGGTGAFTGATGFWEGLTQGRGALTTVAPNLQLPTSILKLMNGYLRLPVKP